MRYFLLIEVISKKQRVHVVNFIVHKRWEVWCPYGYGLWGIENDTVIEADVDPEVKVCSGYLSAGAGVLLLGGYNGAAYKENGAWNVFF
jgi:hypothetical protein